MSLASPVSIIYNTDGYEVTLSQSMTIATTQPGLMVAGSSSLGAKFLRLDTDGTLFITGALSTTPAGTQAITGSVYVTNPWSFATSSNNALLVNQGLSSSFVNAWKVVITDANNSIFGTSTTPLWVTGSMTVPNVVTVTGSVINKLIASTTTVVSSTNASVTNFTILAANANRSHALFYKTGAGIAYLKLGATASPTSYTVQLQNNGYYEIPERYTGQVDIIFSAAGAGTVVSTEVTF